MGVSHALHAPFTRRTFLQSAYAAAGGGVWPGTALLAADSAAATPRPELGRKGDLQPAAAEQAATAEQAAAADWQSTPRHELPER